MSAQNTPDHLLNTLKTLPELPGVYQYFDAEGKLLYIGKAKNLKKRVSSYFHHNPGAANIKLQTLVKKIDDIRYVVVASESDALLLENNLIKQYQPRYNILLKDDKTYPWICITHEPFPRLITTRNYRNDGSIYFGPYTSGRLLHTLLALIKELYPLRTCRLALTTEGVQAHRYKTCLDSQIGNCLAPCVGRQTRDDYLASIEAVKKILRGHIHEVMAGVQNQMVQAANNLEFEKAQHFKQMFNTLSKYQSKTAIVNTQFADIEVYTIFSQGDFVIVNMLRVEQGAIVQGFTTRVNAQLGEGLDEMLTVAIAQIRNRFNLNSSKLLTNIMPDFQIAGLKYSVPTRGDGKTLIDLSLRNCQAYHADLLKRDEAKDPMARQQRILNTLMNDLNLKVQPTHIECFDNSNLQGTNPVAACVVFRNAKPAPRDYRHFIIKTVVGPDDYASMREVVYRRYHRLLQDKQPLPQLVVIDGGKGQLAAAWDSISRLNLNQQITLISIAERLEEIFVVGDSVPIYLDKRSESLKVIQHLRDEAHRFGVRLHTKRRSKKQLSSILTQINGIGPKAVEQLFGSFKSIDEITQAKLDDLQQVIGEARAKLVYEFFHGPIT